MAVRPLRPRDPSLQFACSKLGLQHPVFWTLGVVFCPLQLLIMTCVRLYVLVKEYLQEQERKLLEQDRENQRRQEIKDREVWETQQMRLHDRWHETYYAGCVWRVRR